MSAHAAKPSNPKDALAFQKPPLHLVPTTATALASLAFAHGAKKYGHWNWRVVGVRASVYQAALNRHMTAWWEGEDIDPESGLPHGALALASLMILVDAAAAGMLEDDRPPSLNVPELTLAHRALVARVNALPAPAAPPRHYTIADTRPHAPHQKPQPTTDAPPDGLA